MKKKSILLLALLSTVLACQKDKTVKFGAVLPLTGEAAVYGEPIRKGVELAVEQGVFDFRRPSASSDAPDEGDFDSDDWQTYEIRVEGDRIQVEFDSPQRSVTPGQALVLYDGREVLGGGWIECANGSRS